MKSPETLVPVIDLFAGPGGLGEGFSAYAQNGLKFDVVLSVEKDAAAHQTLLLRTFFRQFRPGRAPDEYYQYLRGGLTPSALFEAFPGEATAAAGRCLHMEMGPQNARRLYAQIERSLTTSSKWILIGGPPCQAYSVVGRSRRARVDRREFERDERHTLYREYLRVLARYKPAVFIMENVKGLLSATLSGTSTFDRVKSDLSAPSLALRDLVTAAGTQSRKREYSILSFVYDTSDPEALEPRDYVIEAEKFGVPQKRHRVILLGVRSDLCNWSRWPSLSPSAPPPVRQMISDLHPLRSQLSDRKETASSWADTVLREFSETRLSGTDPDIVAAMRASVSALRKHSSTGGRSLNSYHPSRSLPGVFAQWIRDERMDFVCNHETRRHMSKDLVRYMFASCYARVTGRSPKLHDFPAALVPEHLSAKQAIATRHGYFNDRFRVQIGSGPATTVTCHMAKDGHSFIHHDPSQCRGWTVREAARIQTFPDNYFFEGTRTDQYRQVGNAVPPYLAYQLAEVVARILRRQPVRS
jgi:DNA (cytosine-5)-methyltransferase 1